MKIKTDVPTFEIYEEFRKFGVRGAIPAPRISDIKTGIPPVFKAEGRARWLQERDAMGIEALFVPKV